MKLRPHLVEKPWGRLGLPYDATGAGGRRIGEIWFEAPDGRALPLLVKHIFTSERLSVQVHPDDEYARARGLPSGKSECWYIVEAEPEATIALGFREEVDRDRLRAAALDGSIEALLDWKPVRAGDFYHVPAGTVHAIGGGIALVEVQQPVDVTYRLYDYGRPRELHLEEALEVACREEYPEVLSSRGGTGELLRSRHFSVRRFDGADETGDERFVIPLAGSVEAGGETAGPGECLFLEAGEAMRASDDADLLVARAG